MTKRLERLTDLADAIRIVQAAGVTLSNEKREELLDRALNDARRARSRKEADACLRRLHEISCLLEP